MRVLRDLYLAVPALGGTAFAVTLAVWTIDGGNLLLTDDPYIASTGVLAMLTPSVVAAALVRWRGGSERAAAVAYAAPVVAWCVAGVVVGAGAELHGGGVVLILGAALVAAAWAVWKALPVVARSYGLRAALWVVAGLWVIGAASGFAAVWGS